MVSGHIDGVGTITRLEKRDIATLVTIRAPAEVMRYIIRKGSVAIDGISLTVVDFNRNPFRFPSFPIPPALPHWVLKERATRSTWKGI